MISRKNVKIISLLVAICLIFSVFALTVFAATENSVVFGTGDDVTAEATEIESNTETTVEETETTAETTADTTETTTPTETTAPADSGDSGTTPATKNWFEEHINLIIALGVIVVLVIAYFVARLISKKFREKTTKFWKDYRAEFEKLVWPTKEQFWRNSAVVLVAVVVGAIVLALLDYGITQGLRALKELIDTIRPAG
jgi:preprotein translocase subunit SecE